MNEVTWVVQSNLIDYRQLSKVCDAVLRCKAKLLEAVVIPFSETLDNEEDLMKEDLTGLVVPYGSTSLCKKAVSRGWSGVFFDEAIFRTDVFAEKLGDLYLNHDQTILTVREAMEWTKRAIEIHPEREDELMFIRPIKDLKQFNGTVTKAKEIARWLGSVESGNFSFDADTLVAIASPKKLTSESRFFVVGGKVVDGSFYRMHGIQFMGQLNPEELESAQEIADVWLPHECCVMDLAKTEDGVKVIEYNCLNGSGFYANDIDKVVSAVTDYMRTLP